MSISLLLLAPAITAGAIISTVSGGGMGILVLVLGSFFFDIRTNIVFSSILMIGMQICKIFHFHLEIRWQYVWWYILLGVPCSFLGGLILFQIPTRVPEIGLAATCTGFVILRMIRPTFRLPATRGCLLGYGALNGFIGGIIGNAALIRGPIFLSLGLTKGAFIGTSSIVAFLMNLGKISAYLTEWQWSYEVGVFLLVALPFLFMGVWFGKRLLKHVSARLFEGMLLGIIVIGGLRLLFLST
ncbi:MAG: sulfite exporter TauE/SafE family protein [Candidatus Peribacteraceae bacterium]|nr:sulfite exporter TauE/SafE family protein [Candidatus Peribacteraceae bacterium]